MSDLPLDVLETIIDTLALDDASFSATKACSLVCHVFLHICRKHIFSSIGLNTGPLSSSSRRDCKQNGRSEGFIRLLRDTPAIAGHIRKLNYRIATYDLRNSRLVIQTFTTITRIRSLIIHSGTSEFVSWDNIPIRPALLHLLHLPTLVQLRLDNTKSFMPTDLAPCLNLEHFSFGNVWMLDMLDAPSPLYMHSPLNLRCMDIDTFMSHPGVKRLCELQCMDGTPFINFNYLSVLVRSADLNNFHSLLSHCDRLLGLNLRLPPTSLISYASMNLADLSKVLIETSSLETLKSLKLLIPFNGSSGVEDLFRGLVIMLEHISNKNIIESIIVELKCENQLSDHSVNKFGQLDHVLGCSGWPNLRRISLTMSLCYNTTNAVRAALQQTLQAKFPKLSSKKSLVFTFLVQKQQRSEWQPRS